jgi:adenylate cyclase
MATDLARAMPPVSFSAIGIYWGMLAGMGLYTAEELVDEMRDALARAESFGDRFGIIAAQWTYGTLLLKSGRGRREEAIDLLKRAEEGIGKHRLQAFALSITGTQLAVEDARDGHRDEAIEALRRLVWSHTAEASPVLMGCPAEALCELLIDRDAPADRREVAEVLAEWRRRSPGTAPMDRWTVRMRALLTGAQDSRAD